MKKKIEEYPSFKDLPKDLIQKLGPTYEDNIEEITGYENLSDDTKKIISTHKLIVNLTCGGMEYKGKDIALNGFWCENCGTVFTLTPTQFPSYSNSDRRSISLDDIYIECSNFRKCSYSLKSS